MTDKQTAASRANGAKSSGPKTKEGRKRSALNALKHGLCSDIVLLGCESKDAFNQLRQKYLEQFQPANTLELDLLEQVVSASWRLRRAWAMEAAALEKELLTNARHAPSGDSITPEDSRLCAAHQNLMTGESQFLTNLSRHESHHVRLFYRALQALLKLKSSGAQASCQDPPPFLSPQTIIEKLRNEPEPEAQRSTIPPSSATLQNEPEPEESLLPNETGADAPAATENEKMQNEPEQPPSSPTFSEQSKPPEDSHSSSDQDAIERIKAIWRDGQSKQKRI